MSNPQQQKDKLPHADFIDERRDELMETFMHRNNKKLTALPTPDYVIMTTACDGLGYVPVSIEILKQWMAECATQENDAKVLKDMSRWVSQKFDEVIDKRLIPSVAAKWMLRCWDADIEAFHGSDKTPSSSDLAGGIKSLYPEHEREERKRRLESYIVTMETFENVYDMGKIPNPHEHINNYHFDEELAESKKQ